MHQRKAARWGYIKPPATGKLVWLCSGADENSIALGVELTRAIREKRLDVQLVLSVEREIPALLNSLQPLPKTAWGYAPSDHPRAIDRALSRLNPLALIFCATAPRANLAGALSRIPHSIAVAAAMPGRKTDFEYVYPASEAQAQSWHSQAAAPAVDMNSLLVEAQVDPNFRTLVNGSSMRHLWWLHSGDEAQARDLATRFSAVFSSDILFISGLPKVPQQRGATTRWKQISRWDRSALSDGDIVLVDDQKWLPAVAAAVTATHLEAPSSRVLWQAMAGGAATSCDDHAALPKSSLREALAEFKSHEVLLYQWRAYRDNPILARGSADAARRKFWQERRLAASVNAEFLERVFAW